MISFDIQKACALLCGGELVGMPTETVYGLAADATHDHAVAKIYETKKRPQFNPLILHVESMSMVEDFAVTSPPILDMLNHFWLEAKASLTVVLAKRPGTKLSTLATAGLETVALRMPQHPMALELIRSYGSPLVAPSANPSNRLSATTPETVHGYFPSLFILNGGACTVGVESTIIACEEGKLPTLVPTLLRPGGTPLENLEAYFKAPLKSPSSNTIQAPGMLKQHYAPKTPLFMNCDSAQSGEALLGFGPNAPTQTTLNLSPMGDLKQAATNLFAMLHQLDSKGYTAIRVMPIPNHGLGWAINDRLKRASQNHENQ